MAVPKLRFKEFDGDWFQSKIGEIFQVTSGSTPLRSDNRFFENADIAWVKTTDLNNGLIEKTEEKISQIALKETSVKILPAASNVPLATLPAAPRTPPTTSVAPPTTVFTTLDTVLFA